MMRWLFTGLAALVVLAATSFWSRSPEPVVLPASAEPPQAESAPPLPAPARAAEPKAVAAAPVAEARAPEAPRPAESASLETPPPATRAASPATPPPEPDPAPPVVAEPRIDEEEVLEIVERPEFEDGPARASQPSGDEPLDDEPPADELPQVAEASSEPPAPVDVEHSGDLIRRMLVLYDAMRE